MSIEKVKITLCFWEEDSTNVLVIMTIEIEILRRQEA